MTNKTCFTFDVFTRVTISQFTCPFLYQMDLTEYICIILSDEEKRAVAVRLYVPCSCGGLKTAWTYSAKGVAGI